MSAGKTTYICPLSAQTLLKQYEQVVRATDRMEDETEDQAGENRDGVRDLQSAMEGNDKNEDELARQIFAECRGDGTAIYLATCRGQRVRDNGRLWVDPVTKKSTRESPLWRLDGVARERKGHVVHESGTGRSWPLSFSVQDSLPTVVDAIRTQLAVDMPADGRGVFHHTAKAGSKPLYTSASHHDTVVAMTVIGCSPIRHGSDGTDTFEVFGQAQTRGEASKMSLSQWIKRHGQDPLAKIAETEPILVIIVVERNKCKAPVAGKRKTTATRDCVV